MMKLKIQTIATNKFNVSVAWFSGLSKNGVIDVRVSQIEHRIAVAELTVARYLLWGPSGIRPSSRQR